MENIYGHDPQLNIEPDHYSGGIPVFKPRYEEFKDFYKFNKAINKYGMQSGVVKVIPPKEWLNSVSHSYTQKNLESIKIKNPIIQQINGSGNGIFNQQNVERSRTYNIFQWQELSQKPNHQPPAPRGKTRHNSKDPSSSKSNIRHTRSHSNGNGNHSIKRNSPYKGHRRDSSDYNIDVKEFDEERCEQLERIYWKSLTYAEPMYGADSMGSLFSDKIKHWNVAHLPNLLDLMDVKLPGVNDAYLYAGLWKATFAWHLEDQDLYSINYLHFGAPKQWYSIPQSEANKFFNVMKDVFPEEYKNCHDFLRHKTFLVSPQFLDKHDVKYNKIIHNEKEFMITYPYGYHAGFNYGYNLAESVNFALDDWFPIAEKTSKCECISDSVGINVKELYCKFKGIPYEVPDLTSDTGEESDGSDNPDNLKYQEALKIGDSKSKSVSKSKSPRVKQEQLKATPKSVKRKQSDLVSETDNKTKKLKVESPTNSNSIKRALKDECYLCPNRLPKELLNTHQFELLETDQSETKVHRICSTLFPNELSNKEDNISGISNISRAQKNLKCFYCGLKGKGACFQCSYGKCVRAYHGTCCLNDGVLLDFNKKEFICKYHRQKYTSEGCQVTQPSLLIGSLVQFKKDEKLFSSGIVHKNLPEEQKLQILSYPDLNKNISVNYEDLVIFDHVLQDAFFTIKKPNKKIRAAHSSDIKSKKHDRSEKISKVLLEDKSVTGLSHKNLNLSRRDNYLIEVVKEKFPTVSYKEIWYNLPSHSSDQLDRYTDDFNSPIPNDPVYLKHVSRKKNSNKIALNNKKLEVDINENYNWKASKQPRNDNNKSILGRTTSEGENQEVKSEPVIGTFTHRQTPNRIDQPSNLRQSCTQVSLPPLQVPQKQSPVFDNGVSGSPNNNPTLPPLYNFVTKPRTPVHSMPYHT